MKISLIYHLLNLRGTQNKHLIEISKEMWGYLVERTTHLIAEYIPSLRNETADWASPNFQDSSEWKLCPTVFKQICSLLGKPLLDPGFQTLLPTAMIHNLATRPSKCSNRCISTGLEIPISVCFSTTLNDRKGIKESSKRPYQHDYYYTHLAEPVIVSNPVENDYEISNSLTKSFKSFTQSRRQNSSSNPKLVTENGGMASIR